MRQGRTLQHVVQDWGGTYRTPSSVNQELVQLKSVRPHQAQRQQQILDILCSGHAATPRGCYNSRSQQQMQPAGSVQNDPKRNKGIVTPSGVLLRSWWRLRLWWPLRRPLDLALCGCLNLKTWYLMMPPGACQLL